MCFGNAFVCVAQHARLPQEVETRAPSQGRYDSRTGDCPASTQRGRNASRVDEEVRLAPATPRADSYRFLVRSTRSNRPRLMAYAPTASSSAPDPQGGQRRAGADRFPALFAFGIDRLGIFIV